MYRNEMSYEERLMFMALTTLETRQQMAELYKAINGLEGISSFVSPELVACILIFRLDISKCSFSKRIECYA